MCSCTPKQFLMYTWASNVISDNFWKCMVCMEAHGVNIALSEVILCAHVYTKRQMPFFPAHCYMSWFLVFITVLLFSQIRLQKS